MKNKSIVIANLSWNNTGWKKPVINPRAHHQYATNFPGHESLNFQFDKIKSTVMVLVIEKRFLSPYKSVDADLVFEE